MVSFGLVKQGWDNLKGLVDGNKSAKDILAPSAKDIFGQVRAAQDPTPALVGGAGELVKAAPEIVVDTIKGSNFLKYAAIGGAALLAVAVLRRK